MITTMHDRVAGICVSAAHALNVETCFFARRGEGGTWHMIGGHGISPSNPITFSIPDITSSPKFQKIDLPIQMQQRHPISVQVDIECLCGIFDAFSLVAVSRIKQDDFDPNRIAVFRTMHARAAKIVADAMTMQPKTAVAAAVK